MNPPIRGSKKARKAKQKEESQDSAEERGELQADESATTDEESAPVLSTEPQTLEDWKERALRAQADMVNMRRRMETEVEDRTRMRLESLFMELITVADHMDLALQAVPAELSEQASAKSFLQGIQAIQYSLQATFQNQGLQAISPTENEAFDSELHEAVRIEKEEGLEQEQVRLLRRGFRLGRRILRPAQILLVRPAQNEASPADAPESNSDEESTEPDREQDD